MKPEKEGKIKPTFEKAGQKPRIRREELESAS